MKKIRSEREKGRKREREIYGSFRAPVSFLILSLTLFGVGCQPNPTIMKDVAPPSPSPLETVEMKKTTFEEDLREMQTADFDYIFAFRRKDGGAFDSDDRKYLRQNTPLETNRWRQSDDGRAFIAGSGFGFTPEQLEALRSRFIVEDYSKPETRQAANKPANTGNANSSNADRPPANK